MKLYLDTNIVAGWFKKNITNIRKDKPLADTKTLLTLNNKTDRLYVSDLTFIEIVNYLKSSFSANVSEISLLWNLITDLYNIRILHPETKWENITNIATAFSMKKGTIIDIVHLEISKSNGCLFLAFDKELSKFTNYYNISFL